MRCFGFVLSRLFLIHLGFDSDFAQISGQKIGGWAHGTSDDDNISNLFTYEDKRGTVVQKPPFQIVATTTSPPVLWSCGQAGGCCHSLFNSNKDFCSKNQPTNQMKNTKKKGATEEQTFSLESSRFLVVIKEKTISKWTMKEKPCIWSELVWRKHPKPDKIRHFE